MCFVRGDFVLSRCGLREGNSVRGDSVGGAMTGVFWSVSRVTLTASLSLSLSLYAAASAASAAAAVTLPRRSLVH